MMHQNWDCWHGSGNSKCEMVAVWFRHDHVDRNAVFRNPFKVFLSPCPQPFCHQRGAAWLNWGKDFEYALMGFGVWISIAASSRANVIGSSVSGVAAVSSGMTEGCQFCLF